jgi:hypothetical protein
VRKLGRRVDYLDSAAIRRDMTRWHLVRVQSDTGDHGNRTKKNRQRPTGEHFVLF